MLTSFSKLVNDDIWHRYFLLLMYYLVTLPNKLIKYNPHKPTTA